MRCTVETGDFRRALESAAGDGARNLTQFFDQWVYGRGYPCVKVTIKSNNSNSYNNNNKNNKNNNGGSGKGGASRKVTVSLQQTQKKENTADGTFFALELDVCIRVATAAAAAVASGVKSGANDNSGSGSSGEKKSGTRLLFQTATFDGETGAAAVTFADIGVDETLLEVRVDPHHRRLFTLDVSSWGVDLLADSLRQTKTKTSLRSRFDRLSLDNDVRTQIRAAVSIVIGFVFFFIQRSLYKTLVSQSRDLTDCSANLSVLQLNLSIRNTQRFPQRELAKRATPPALAALESAVAPAHHAVHDFSQGCLSPLSEQETPPLVPSASSAATSSSSSSSEGSYYQHYGVRVAAAKALGKVRTRAAARLLARMLLNERDAMAASAIAEACGAQRHACLRVALLKLLSGRCAMFIDTNIKSFHSCSLPCLLFLLPTAFLYSFLQAIIRSETTCTILHSSHAFLLIFTRIHSACTCRQAFSRRRASALQNAKPRLRRSWMSSPCARRAEALARFDARHNLCCHRRHCHRRYCHRRHRYCRRRCRRIQQCKNGDGAVAAAVFSLGAR
jgi:hypothetical protein